MIISMAGDFFLTDTPLRFTRSGRIGSASDYAVLHQHLGHVQIDAHLEGDRQRVGAVVGALRRHVEHVLHAVDLLLDGRGHRVGHHLGIGPRDSTAETSTVGGVISGYWAMGKRHSREATRPA